MSTFGGTFMDEVWGSIKNLLITAVIGVVLAVPVLLLWNYVAPELGVSRVNYGMAYCLTLLSSILFGWGTRRVKQKSNAPYTSS